MELVAAILADMDNIKDGWFKETCTLWPGQAMSLEVDEVLYNKKSKFQDIMVFKSKTYGNVLVLDGVIQCTERDEFAYQEMIANLPICSHPCPKKVLIIGGGDGGVLREVVKHPLVESVVQCEIDEDVINASKKYLLGMAQGFFSPKLTLHVGDGFEFMKQNQDAFDVIITDSSDPVGPAESLFKESYYQLMKTALRKGGILCCQGKDIFNTALFLSLCKFRALFFFIIYTWKIIAETLKDSTGLKSLSLAKNDHTYVLLILFFTC